LKMSIVMPWGTTVISQLELDHYSNSLGSVASTSTRRLTEVRQYLDPVFKEPAPELG
jgi:hypothetical protein